jgi:hypothetical protein
MSYSPFADDFLAMMPRLVTLAPFLGTTGSGGRSYGPAKQYHAYVTADSKAIFSPTGQTVFSTSRILMHPKATDGTVLAALNPDSLLTLDDGTKPRIIQAGALYDEAGVVSWDIRT